MRNAWHNWRALPFEKKLAIVVAPLLIALVAGVLVPIINRALKSEETPKVSAARLSNMHVERNVTLDEFTARQQTVGRPDPMQGRRFVRFQGEDPDGDSVPAGQDACPDEAGDGADGCPADEDPDGDGVRGAQDACPDEAGDTANGCPADEDPDGDGVRGAQDACPDEAGDTANGCPADEDPDGDGVRGAQDRCPEKKARTADGCPLLPLIVIVKMIDEKTDTGCESEALHKAVKEADSDDCPAVGALIGSDRSGDAVKRAREVQKVLRHTRAGAAGSSGKRRVLGVAVSFDVTLKGQVGRKADVRWSLYHAKGGGRLPYSWLVRHRVTELEGQIDSDQGSGDFWVPLPDVRGPFKVRLEVFKRNGSKLTFAETTTFK